MDESKVRWWDRVALTFLGPPQVGDVNAPMADLPEVVELCSTCGRDWAEHEIVRDPGLTYARCPSD